MKYLYIVVLFLVLVGMFYLGERVPQSPDLTYSTSPSEPLASTYTKKEYCAPVTDAETAKYKLELSSANNKISRLEKELEEAKAGITGTPTPTVTEVPTPSPTEEQDLSTEDKKASSSAKE